MSVRAGGSRRALGQVVVEILLILPVFLLMVFLIMELGYIAFQTLLTNHAAFECARIGSLLSGSIQLEAVPRPDKNASGLARTRASEALNRMIRTARITRFQVVRHNFSDIQTDIRNADLVVRVENRVRLIFPGSSYVLARPRGSGALTIRADARMPVELPNSRTLR